MNLIKTFKMFESSNEYSYQEVLNCIKNDGTISCDSVYGNPEISEKDIVKPLTLDEDGLITLEYEGSTYETNLKNVKKINY